MKLDSLLTGLKSPNRKKRLYALIDLGMMGGKAKAAVSEIQNLLSDREEEIRINAILALKDIVGRHAEQMLLPLLDDPSPKVQACVAASVGLLGNRSLAYPLLHKMLASPDKEVRDAAKLFVDDLEDFETASQSAPPRGEMHSVAYETRVVNCVLHKELRVSIGLLDGHSLTEIQDRILRTIHQIPQRISAVIRQELARIFVADGHGNLIDTTGVEAFEVTIDCAMIPALKEAKDAYFFLCGQSDFDIEHGFACLVKNGTQFCVCAPELSQENYRLDDAEAFERILRSHTVVDL